MSYYEKTLLSLDNIKKSDKNILALFAFGSFVTEETSTKNYKEIRVFDKGEYILSKFNLINIFPDIDMICVSENPEETKTFFEKEITDVFGHYVTVNVMSKDVFQKEILSEKPTAVKRIILYRKLMIIKGQEFVDTMRNEALKAESTNDSLFQDEFVFRKNYLRMFAHNNVGSFILTKEDHQKLFPNFLKFIQGQVSGGFPKDRLKLVFPEPMDLKAEVDLSELDLKNII